MSKKTKAKPIPAAQRPVAKAFADRIKQSKAERMNDNGGEIGLQALISGQYGAQTTNTRMMPGTMSRDTGYAPVLTLNRPLLSYNYMSQGLVALAVDYPVNDAIREGFTYDTDELSQEELEMLNYEVNRPRGGMKGSTTNLGQVESRAVQPTTLTDMGPSTVDNVIYTMKWKRLFGGAALIINTDQDFRQPFNIDKLTKDSPLEFIPCDRWEIGLMNTNIFGQDQIPYNYYGCPVNRSRVVKFNNKEAPSLIRMRLQGWGLSELESVLPAINAFLKFEDLMFELLDEAKIDIYKFDGFNNILLTSTGTAMAQARVAMANQMKNFQNAIMLDKNDDYTQKTYNFAGMADIWNECRRNLSAYFRIPMTKLFGESAGGMGGGQDSLENYNALVLNERHAMDPALIVVGQLTCKVLFGFVPTKLKVVWPPLRILDGVEQEQVNTAKQARVVELFINGLITEQEAMQELKKSGVFTASTEVLRGEKKVDPLLAQGLGAEGVGISDSMQKRKKDKGDKREKQRAVSKDNREAR